MGSLLGLAAIAFAACSDPDPSPRTGIGARAPASAEQSLERARSLSGAARDALQSVTARASSDAPLRVTLPDRARAPVVIEDVRSGLAVGVRALDAGVDSPREPADGIAVYRAAHAGGDVFWRVQAHAAEDFVALDAPPPRGELRYAIGVERVAGLRLVDDVLELLDAGGVPRLRARRPYVLDARGRRIPARLSVRGCAVDSDPRAPFGRPVVAPGSAECELAVAVSGATYPVLVDPAWTATGDMVDVRDDHTLDRLANGRAIAVGGVGVTPLASAELYDPATKTWAVTGSMSAIRYAHDAIRLPSGKLLVSGGEGGAANAELYDPATGSWSATGTPSISRTLFTMVALPDGRVLLAGGRFAGKTTEVYDPATQQFSTVGSMAYPHEWHAGVVLAGSGSSARVVIGGGDTVNEATELFNPTTNTWSSGGDFSVPGQYLSAVRLADGRALFTGGVSGSAHKRADIYTPGSGWSSAAAMIAGRATHGSELLDDGRVLVFAGGPTLKSSEIYDPQTNSWQSAGALVHGGNSRKGTKLADGSVLVAGGVENYNVGLDAAELFVLQGSGAPCSLSAECASGVCADGVCCSTACTGTCMSCRGLDTGGSDGTCAPVSANTDPSGDCKDDGAPACQNNGLCDGAGACAMYPVSSGCTPLACTSGSQCASGVCADGICCDKPCGTCQACTAAKKGAGVDGVCEPVLADTDPDDECEEGANYPTSCLADGMCDGAGACREFAKDTVSCGNTQCIAGLAEGLLCNGAGQCLAAKKSCDPYLCQGDACLQSCQDDNDCMAGAHCTSLGACAIKVVNGTSCTLGKECQSGYCVDGVCCGESCSGQCEACNVAPNQGTCVGVIGAPVGARPECAGDGGDCSGSCDGVNRTACVLPPAGESCGTASCSNGSLDFGECDGKGACVQNTEECSPYACDVSSCRTDCSSDDHCGQGFSCDLESGKCVPSAGKCLSDGVTLETSGGETKDCSPYRCLGGQCAQPCATSSQCVEGFACDLGECVPLANADTSSEDGCGCATARTTAARSLPVALLSLALALRRRRRRNGSP